MDIRPANRGGLYFDKNGSWFQRWNFKFTDFQRLIVLSKDRRSAGPRQSAHGLPSLLRLLYLLLSQRLHVAERLSEIFHKFSDDGAARLYAVHQSYTLADEIRNEF